LTTDMTNHPAGLDHYNGGLILWFSLRQHAPNRCAEPHDGVMGAGGCKVRLTGDTHVWIPMPRSQGNHPASSQITLARCCLRVIRWRGCQGWVRGHYISGIRSATSAAGQVWL